MAKTDRSHLQNCRMKALIEHNYTSETLAKIISGQLGRWLSKFSNTYQFQPAPCSGQQEKNIICCLIPTAL